jgi:hypothetical protein
MIEVKTIDDLMKQLSNMNKDNSVCQVFIPGRGKFTIVMQDEIDYSPISIIQTNHGLKLIDDVGTGGEKEGHAISSTELMRNPFL